MANSYTRVIFHCIWSTKSRQKLISAEWESNLWSYISGIALNHGIHPIQIGGFDDHIHALVEPNKNMNLPEILQVLKTPSSNWVNKSGYVTGKFNWQIGYGVFSVSPRGVSNVANYIQNQRKHHAHKSFEEEYRELMRWHGVDFDEKYLLG